MCMSLKADAFIAFRKIAMGKRKDRILLNQHSEVKTIKEIADALKNTQMVNGKPSRPSTHTIYSFQGKDSCSLGRS